MAEDSSLEIHPPKPSLPVQPGERIVLVDILRGFAVFGILVANMASFSGHTTALQVQPAGIDSWVLLLTRFLITAKFYSLFSFLFGWGMSVQMVRARERGTNFTSLYLRRLLVLLLIGLVHGVLIWSGDILTIYALLGFLLFLTRNRSDRTILILMVLCLLFSIFLSAPWKIPQEIISRYQDITAFLRLELVPSDAYSSGSYLEITQLRIEEYLRVLSNFLNYFGNIFSMFLLGLWVGRRRLFHEVDRYLPLLQKVLAGGFLVGILGNALNVWLILHPSEMPAIWLPQSYHRMVQQVAYTLSAPALMLFYVSGIALLLRKKYWQNLLGFLANVGRMALSNYLFQSIVATLIFYNYGLGIYGEISPTFGLILTVIIFLIQIRISEWWFSHFNYGPIEWIWRFLTYGRSPLPLAEISSFSSKKYERIKNFFERLKDIHPAWGIGIAWLVLLIWAGFLINWKQDIEATRQLSGFNIVISETAIPTHVPVQEDMHAHVDETVQDSNPSLLFLQTQYPARSATANIDVEALVGAFNLEFTLSEIETLTDETFGGRYAGSPQGRAAGDYLAEQFSSYGLLPLGDQGTYFQEFYVTYTPLAKSPRLYMDTPTDSTPEEFIAYQDFSPVVRWYAGSGSGKGQVYWLNRCSEDDFAARDMVGKVLLCLPDTQPNWLAQQSRRALEHGAAALLFLTDPEIRPPDFGWSFKEIWVPEPLPVYFVYPDMVNRLLAGTEINISDLLANQHPFQLESTVGFEIEIAQSDTCPGAKCIARNVIGILPGRDPAYAKEAIIIGAHYDHMGQAPNGIYWPGANDDASGVAVLLEIARSWKEQDYIPKRSVIFAAWDAEELGLLGAVHYVENPPYPLGDTIAMIQLDMIGAGTSILRVDGNTSLSKRITYISETFGVETSLSDSGGSDHVPFLSVGIPANALIWEIPSNGESDYHQPSDTIQTIDDERLLTAAQITELTTLDLVESEPSIQDMLSARARAAQEGNLETYLSSSHPDQIQNDIYWFQDLQTLQPKQVSLKAENLLIAGNLGTASVRIEVDYIEPTENITHTLIANIPASFSHEASGWKWSGTQQVWNKIEKSLDERTAFEVGYPPGKEKGVVGVGHSAIEQYQRVTDLLGLSPDIQARFLVLADEEDLWGSTAMAQPKDKDLYVIPGEVKLVYSEAISTSLLLQESMVQLMLAEGGVSETLAPWLWQGLPLVVQGYDQPISTQIKLLPSLQRDLLLEELPPNDQVRSWAAASYLQERLGWSGLGNFIYSLGQRCLSGCSPEQVLNESLLEFINLDTEGFESAWQNAWKIRLETAQDSLDTLLLKRTLAFSNSDKQMLLETIDHSVPNLDIEEIHWLEDYQFKPPNQFSIKGRPLAFLEGGSLLTEITMEYQYLDDEDTSSTFNILLTPAESGYVWAGPLMERLTGQWIDLIYPSDQLDLATSLLDQAEQIYTRVTSYMEIEKTGKVIIKLYDSQDSYSASISMSLSQTNIENIWIKPGDSIKLQLTQSSKPQNYNDVLANQLTRHILYQKGIETNWLVEGISAFLSIPYVINSSSQLSGLQTVDLFEIATSGTVLILNDSAPAVQPSREEYEISISATRDAIDYLVTNYGWSKLLELLDAQESGASLEYSFQTSLGITLEQFFQNWHNSLLQKHIHPEWVEMTQSFLPGQAMGFIDYLASPTLAGRQAGSPGSDTAAEYIAQKFEAYDLLPIGDLITATNELDDSTDIGRINIPVSGTLHTYFQTFPISYTYQASLPKLRLVDETGETLASLTYRQDFLPLREASCSGILSAPLVWGGNQAYPDINLEGKVILRTKSSDRLDEINNAIRHGAAGLILTNNKWEPEELFAKQPLFLQDFFDSSIPVVEITQPGYSRLLEALGYDRQSIARLPTFQTINGIVEFDCDPYRFSTVQTNNVLGILPGTDPYLSQQVIILGAHYDHVGDDPDGLQYSGRNDNASGVAALLEIARLLHDQGYQPKRSILFAAWGAQELGQLGSNYFISHPSYPLQDIVAMIQLDGVGGGDGFNLGIQGSTETDAEVLFYLNAAEQMLQEKLVITPPFNKSDDTPFRLAEIPSVLISWRLANEDNLPDMLGNAIHQERLSIAGQVTTLLLLALAR